MGCFGTQTSNLQTSRPSASLRSPEIESVSGTKASPQVTCRQHLGSAPHHTPPADTSFKRATTLAPEVTEHHILLGTILTQCPQSPLRATSKHLFHQESPQTQSSGSVCITHGVFLPQRANSSRSFRMHRPHPSLIATVQSRGP